MQTRALQQRRDNSTTGDATTTVTVLHTRMICSSSTLSQRLRHNGVWTLQYPCQAAKPADGCRGPSLSLRASAKTVDLKWPKWELELFFRMIRFEI
jgi:hypothetical protein